MRSKKVIGLAVAACLVVFYFILFTPRIYSSEARIVVEKTASSSNSGSNGLMALMQTGASFKEARMLQEFVYSSAMLDDLDRLFDLRSHYAQPLDPFHSIRKGATKEEAQRFFEKMVPIRIEELSGLITIQVKTFDPELSQKVLEYVLVKSEGFLNKAASDVVSGQLSFLTEQVKKNREELEKARTDLVVFQDNNRLLTPQDAANPVLGAIGKLESDLVGKRAELSSQLAFMHSEAPEVIKTKNYIKALETQITAEKARLVGPEDKSRVSVSAAAYEKQKMRVELATDLYKSALAILEKAEFEAAKKTQTVVMIQAPTKPEEPSYPRLVRDIPITLILGAMTYLLLSLIVQVVREHR